MSNLSIENTQWQETQKTKTLPSINVHGTTSKRQATADSNVIPPAMSPSILSEWPDLFDAEFIAILTKADEMLICIVETLVENWVIISIIM